MGERPIPKQKWRKNVLGDENRGSGVGGGTEKGGGRENCEQDVEIIF